MPASARWWCVLGESVFGVGPRRVRRACLAVALILLCAGCAGGPAGRRDPAEFWRTFARERGGVAPRRQLASLAGRLTDKDPAVRRRAAAEAGKLGYAAAPLVPALIERLQDEDAWVLSDAAVALCGILPPREESVPAYRRLLRSDNPNERLWALRRLSHVACANALRVSEVVKGLRDPDPIVRRAWHWFTLRWWNYSIWWQHSPAEVEAALQDAHSEVRKMAVSSIPTQALSDYSEQILKALGDPHWKVRSRAIRTLDSLLSNPQPLLSAYASSVYDEIPQGVAGVGDRQAEDLCPAKTQAQKALEDYRKGGKGDGFVFLSSFLLPDALLAELNQSEPDKLLMQAMLTKCADSDNPGIRRGAVYNLRYHHTDAAVLVLKKTLQDPDPDVRVGSILTLERIKKPLQKTVPLLTRALQDPDRRVRIEAASALAAIDPVHSRGNVIAALTGSGFHYGDVLVWWISLENLGPLARDMTRFLVEYYNWDENRQMDLKMLVPMVLGSIGQGGVPLLMEYSRKNDALAADVLSNIRPVSLCVWRFFSEELLNREDKVFALAYMVDFADDVPKQYVKEETIETLYELLKHSDERVRVYACENLIALGRDDGRALGLLKTLAPRVQDKGPITYALLGALSCKPKDREIVSALVRTLQTCQNDYAVHEALESLALMRSRAALAAPLLAKWLATENSGRRRGDIIDTLTQIAPGDSKAIRAITFCLRNDKNPHVRARAARGLAACGETARGSIADLSAVAAEPPSFASRAAVIALGRIARRTDKAVMQLLIEKLINEDEIPYIRRAAYDALKLILARKDGRQ